MIRGEAFLAQDDVRGILLVLARATVVFVAWLLMNPNVVMNVMLKIVMRIESAGDNQRIQTRTRKSKRSISKRTNCQVSFGHEEILEFPSILGDNPSVKSGGAPVTMAWSPVRVSTRELPIEDDENDSTRSRPRVLSAKERENRLLANGINLLDIERASMKKLSTNGHKTKRRPFKKYPYRALFHRSSFKRTR